MFLGQYRHQLDKKGRVTIPSRFRESLADGAFIFQGFDNNLLVMTPDSFEQITSRISHLSFTDPTARDLSRLLFSNAAHIDIDGSGRMLIPPFLRESIGLEKEVVLVGTGSHFEVWAAEPWDRQAAKLNNPEANATRFAAIDISLGEL